MDPTLQPQVKIIDRLRANAAGGVHVSFEFFPPKTPEGEEKLKQHLISFSREQPVFVDFTWGAGGGTAQKTPELCLLAKQIGFVVNMHLTCTNMDMGKVDEALIFCLNHGIRNIVALRGDPPAGEQWRKSEEGFACALDLVKYIRRHYGSYFCLAVAGYPEGHPDKIASGVPATGSVMTAELDYLKAKVDAGADYIITQLFYDTGLFLRFVEQCKQHGIHVPILPGILPPLAYGGLQRMVSLCKTHIPNGLRDKVEALKDAGDEKFREFGIELSTQMSRELLAHGVKHLHFYTLNQTHSTLGVLRNLNMLKHE